MKSGEGQKKLLYRRTDKIKDKENLENQRKKQNSLKEIQRKKKNFY